MRMWEEEEEDKEEEKKRKYIGRLLKQHSSIKRMFGGYVSAIRFQVGKRDGSDGIGV